MSRAKAARLGMRHGDRVALQTQASGASWGLMGMTGGVGEQEAQGATTVCSRRSMDGTQGATTRPIAKY